MTEDSPGRPAEAQERDGPVGEGRRPRRRGRGRRRAGGRGTEGKDSPQRVGGLIRTLLERWGVTEQVERARAAGRWEEVVGPRVAERTRRVRVSGRTLFVEVESASWANELNMMRHRYLEKLNEGLEGEGIEKIVFLQAGDESANPDHPRG